MKITKSNLIFAAKIAAAYLAVFLIGKLLNGNPGLPITEWLLDDSPLNHSYLFGWLISHERYWKYSVVSIFSAMFGMHRFASATFAGFAAGLALGEVYDAFFAEPFHTSFPYPWQIWFFTLLASIILGIILELKKKKA